MLPEATTDLYIVYIDDSFTSLHFRDLERSVLVRSGLSLLAICVQDADVTPGSPLSSTVNNGSGKFRVRAQFNVHDARLKGLRVRCGLGLDGLDRVQTHS